MATTLTVLMENQSRTDTLTSEHGLSFLIDHNGFRILLDTGASKATLANAVALGCDLKTIKIIALSHGHYDHSGGLEAILRHISASAPDTLPQIIMHPDALLKRRRDKAAAAKQGEKDLSIPITARKLLEDFSVTETTKPLWLQNDIVFLGEIPRPRLELCALLGEIYKNGTYMPDQIADDTGIAIITPKGLLIIVGCAHAGIVNTIEYAKAVTKMDAVYAIIGGLHMKGMTPEVQETTLTYLAKLGAAHIHACHCSGDLLAKAGISQDIHTGDQLTFS